MKKLWIAAFALHMGIMTGPAVHAQIYKWIDDKGKINFGDKPEDARTASEAENVELKPNYQPPDRTAEEIKALDAQREALEEEMQRRMQSAAQEKARQRTAHDEQLVARCRKLDEVIARFGSAKRVNGRLRIDYVTGEDGLPISEEAQREAVEELKRKRAALHCKAIP
jgi:hypothetical protein